jgi:O-antigen/teichoic acid export membrane protein
MDSSKSQAPALLDEELPREAIDITDASASVPPSSGYRAILQTLFRGEMSGAAIALVIRQVVIMGLSVGSSVAVARWLGPEIVGRFAILIFVTQGILGYFGDLGLKAALIRKRGDLETTELSTAQTVIFGISVTFAVVIGALLPVAFRLVKLGPENYLPGAVFLVFLIVRNQRMVPLALLERAMRFKVVSAVEAAESLIYTVLLATLAFLHKGIWCYVIAMGCRDLFGSLAFTLIARPPFRQFSWASIRPHIGFSLIYQGGSLLNMATLAFPPILIARVLGKTAVGYVSWAYTLSLYPLVICNAMGRIYLPAFSSAAGDPARLRSRVEKSLRINASIAWPACAVLASLSTPIIAHVFTAKWFPAQPLLYAYCINATYLAVGIPLSELFFAQGDAWFNLRLCLWMALLTWIPGSYAVFHYGLLGFAIAQGALQSIGLLAFFHARKTGGLHVFAPLLEPLILSTALIFGNLLIVRSVAITSIYRLGLLLVIEGIICALFLVRMIMSWRTETNFAELDTRPRTAIAKTTVRTAGEASHS